MSSDKKMKKELRNVVRGVLREEKRKEEENRGRTIFGVLGIVFIILGILGMLLGLITGQTGNPNNTFIVGMCASIIGVIISSYVLLTDQNKEILQKLKKK